MIPAPVSASVSGGRARESVDFVVLQKRLTQVALAFDARLDQVVAVDRGRHRDAVAPGLHELEQPGLAQHILEHDAVGTQEEVALARHHVLALRVVQVPEQHLVRQGQRLAQAVAHDLEVLRHGRVNLCDHRGSGFDGGHFLALFRLGGVAGLLF